MKSPSDPDRRPKSTGYSVLSSIDAEDGPRSSEWSPYRIDATETHKESGDVPSAPPFSARIEAIGHVTMLAATARALEIAAVAGYLIALLLDSAAELFVDPICGSEAPPDGLGIASVILLFVKVATLSLPMPSVGRVTEALLYGVGYTASGVLWLLTSVVWGIRVGETLTLSAGHGGACWALHGVGLLSAALGAVGVATAIAARVRTPTASRWDLRRAIKAVTDGVTWVKTSRRIGLYSSSICVPAPVPGADGVSSLENPSTQGKVDEANANQRRKLALCALLGHIARRRILGVPSSLTDRYLAASNACLGPDPDNVPPILSGRTMAALAGALGASTVEKQLFACEVIGDRWKAPPGLPPPPNAEESFAAAQTLAVVDKAPRWPANVAALSYVVYVVAVLGSALWGDSTAGTDIAGVIVVAVRAVGAIGLLVASLALVAAGEADALRETSAAVATRALVSTCLVISWVAIVVVQSTLGTVDVFSVVALGASVVSLGALSSQWAVIDLIPSRIRLQLARESAGTAVSLVRWYTDRNSILNQREGLQLWNDHFMVAVSGACILRKPPPGTPWGDPGGRPSGYENGGPIEVDGTGSRWAAEGQGAGATGRDTELDRVAHRDQPRWDRV